MSGQEGAPKPPKYPKQPPVQPPAVVSLGAEKGRRSGRWRGQDISEPPPQPLWPSYLYRGTYTLLSGDSGVGKTSVGCDLIARATRGGPFPEAGETFKPLRCLILASEDSVGTFALRLRENAAVAENYEVDETVPSLEKLDSLMEGFDLLFLETFDLHMGGAKGNDNSAVRETIQPFIASLRKHNVAALCVKHWNKMDNRIALHRASGAVAYVAASRTALSCSMDATKTRFLTVDKCNLAREAYPLKFSLTGSRVDWLGYDVHAAPGLRPAVADAAVLLKELLAIEGMPAKAVMAAARGAGIPYHLLHEAKVYLKIKPYREGFGTGSRWIWKLPLIEGDGPPEVDLRTLGEEPGEWDPAD